MSSYALLRALSGFTYSAVKKTLTLGPKLGLANFKTSFSTATGYGTISLGRNALAISLVEGELIVDVLVLTLEGKTMRIEPKVVARAGEDCRIRIPL